MKKLFVLFLLISLICCTACDIENTETSSTKIAMPYSTTEYIDGEWTADTITKHFKELGFTNICLEPCNPDEDNFRKNIFNMYISTGWFSEGPWNAGDEFDSTAEIKIFYNQRPLLTINNCPDLATILSSKDLNYQDFCEKYDEHYVEFNGYVIGHSVYDGGTSHIIDITGGDFDENPELSVYRPETYSGLCIRIGDTWDGSIDETVEVGDNVFVVGQISAYWAEYYKIPYIKTLVLSKR